jgi:hypothetical protein
MRVKLGRTVAAAVGFASIVGCAGSGASDASSQGEPLFRVRGSVTSSAVAINNNLVSALTFTPFQADWGHTDFIVMGDHDGRLLESFELKIYEPPPPEALIKLTRSEPAIALGGIGIVSPEHPSRLDWERDARGVMQVCDDSGECGTVALNPCGSLNSASCLGTVVSGKNWGLHGIAGRFVVMYLEEPAQAGGIYSTFFAQGKEIPAGYNLFRYESVISKLSRSDQDAYFKCQQRAQTTALTLFNEDHGTTYKNHDEITKDVSKREADVKLLTAWDGSMIEAFVQEGCILPGAQTLMSDHGEDDPLDIIVIAWEQ